MICVVCYVKGDLTLLYQTIFTIFGKNFIKSISYNKHRADYLIDRVIS